MKSYIVLYFCVLFAITNLLSCKYLKSKNNPIVKDTLLTKDISFPNELLRLQGNEFKKTDSCAFDIGNKIKIVSIVDGTCPKCIFNQLNMIDSIFNSIPSISNNSIIIFILNFSKQDSAYFMREMQPIIKSKGMIFWDNNYNFERTNNLFTSDLNLRTFMVNANNKIIQYGNPVIHPEVLSEYKEKLISAKY